MSSCLFKRGAAFYQTGTLAFEGVFCERVEDEEGTSVNLTDVLCRIRLKCLAEAEERVFYSPPKDSHVMFQSLRL